MSSTIKIDQLCTWADQKSVGTVEEVQTQKQCRSSSSTYSKNLKTKREYQQNPPSSSLKIDIEPRERKAEELLKSEFKYLQRFQPLERIGATVQQLRQFHIITKSKSIQGQHPGASKIPLASDVVSRKVHSKGEYTHSRLRFFEILSFVNKVAQHNITSTLGMQSSPLAEPRLAEWNRFLLSHPQLSNTDLMSNAAKLSKKIPQPTVLLPPPLPPRSNVPDHISDFNIQPIEYYLDMTSPAVWNLLIQLTGPYGTARSNMDWQLTQQVIRNGEVEFQRLKEHLPTGDIEGISAHEKGFTIS